MSDEPTTDSTGTAGSTTSTGAPAPSDRNSLTVGANGPILLHDVHFLDQMAHFNRERIPERNVHAKGTGAFGAFETTEDVSQYTKAALFQPGTKTEMLARFSTVAGEQGSPDTWRDPRGFALKFYTTEGNYDLVGNNTPVFFIRDTMKFPHFIRSQKRRGGSGLRDNHMQWDFWTLNPESAHQVTYLMGDRGIPRILRHMNGYGSHTYMWINAAGEQVLGQVPLPLRARASTDSPAPGPRRSPGQDADFHRRDLRDAIERGDHPQWKLSVQVMPYDDAQGYRLNPFDLTKTWPHADYPLIHVGTMTLEPQPGELLRPDRAGGVRAVRARARHRLLARQDVARPGVRVRDTHRYRIGPNYLQLPVNRPRVEVNTYTFDGPMAYEHSGDQPVYAPNSEGRPYSDVTGPVEDGWAATARWCAPPTSCVPTTTTGARPVRSSARSWTTSSGSASWRPSPVTCSAACTATCSSGPSTTGSNVDAETGKQIEALVHDGDGTGSQRTGSSDLRDTQTHAGH